MRGLGHAWIAATLAHALIFVDLHHVDASQILLHLLAVLHALPVDHVIDVLDLVRAHTRQVLLRCGVTENRLVNR